MSRISLVPGRRPRRAALLLAATVIGAITWLAAPLPAAAAHGDPIEVGHLGGGWVLLQSINDSGVAAGYSYTSDGEARAITFTVAGGPVDILGDAFPFSKAMDVNDSGQVVGGAGTSSSSGEETRAFSWTPGGGFFEIPAPSEDRLLAQFVDNGGLVAGEGHDVGPDGNSTRTYGWVWSPSVNFVELTEAPEELSLVSAVKNGFVAGVSNDGVHYGYTPFLWTAVGGFTSLEKPPGMESAYPYDVNASGQLALYAESGGSTYPFVWTPGFGYTQLGSDEGSPRAINDAGTVVGWGRSPGSSATHVFMWTPDGGRVALEPPGATSSYATDINGSGAVVGAYRLSGNTEIPFVWTAENGFEDLGTIEGLDLYPTQIADDGTIMSNPNGGRPAVWPPDAGPPPPPPPAPPTDVGQGAVNFPVTVIGTGFAPGAIASVPGGGVTVNSTTYISDTELQLVVTVGNGAALGARNVTIAGNPTPACIGCVVITPRPTVTAPTTTPTVPQGADHRNVAVAGTGFVAGATVTVDVAGVTVHDVDVTSATELVLDLSVDGAAATGNRRITVVNPDGGRSALTRAFAVSATPTVTSATPTALQAGLTTSVRVDGSGFPATFVSGGGTVDFGEGTTVVSVVRNNATRLTAQVAVDVGADLGLRSFTVTNPDGGSAQCLDCVTVLGQVHVDRATPSSKGQGSTAQHVLINGGEFFVGATVRISGAGVTAVPMGYDNSKIAVDVTITNGAALGPRDIIVTNPDGGVGTCVGCFTVTARPTITGPTAPSALARGTEEAIVTLPGTNFQPGATVTVAGTGVTATEVGEASPTTLTLSMTVDPGAAIGWRAITVTNPDGGTFTRTNGLRVT